MTEILSKINGIVWGAPALILILGVGGYVTVRGGFPQLRLFPRAAKMFFGSFRNRKNSASYRALCTALAATVGIGNIAGVAGAIALGGPGAIFWMWLCAFLGMGLKFSEAVLAVRYRVREPDGSWSGGPMYMISRGMGEKWEWMARLYAFFGVTAAFGVGGATQINAVISGINGVLLEFGGQESRKTNLIMGILLGVLTAVLLLGGAKRIGSAVEKLVPVASVAYLLFGMGVLILRADAIPEALAEIFCGAFSPRAVTGGVLGSAFAALRVGVSRGVFTNEAGMGTASIAHAGADVTHPAEQGLMGIVEVFVDTMLICTMTALVILCSGVPIPYGTDPGAELTAQAFGSVYGNWVGIYLAAAMCSFAFATVLGWGFYGLQCARYLFGEGCWKAFALLQAGVVVLGAVLQTGTVWMLSEIVNGLMAIPNLIAVAALSPELFRLIGEYRNLQQKIPKNTGYSTRIPEKS